MKKLTAKINMNVYFSFFIRKNISRAFSTRDELEARARVSKRICFYTWRKHIDYYPNFFLWIRFLINKYNRKKHDYNRPKRASAEHKKTYISLCFISLNVFQVVCNLQINNRYTGEISKCFAKWKCKKLILFSFFFSFSQNRLSLIYLKHFLNDL